jgi:hypothetical protein
VYQRQGADEFLSFFDGCWRVSCNIDVGADMCWMIAADDARHPNDIRAGCWREYDGAVWVAAPAVSVVLEGKTHTHGAYRGEPLTYRQCALLMCDCMLLPFNCSRRRSG